MTSTTTSPSIYITNPETLQDCCLPITKLQERLGKDFAFCLDGDSLVPSHLYIIVDFDERATRKAIRKLEASGCEILGIIGVDSLLFTSADIVLFASNMPLSAWESSLDGNPIDPCELDGYLEDILVAGLSRTRERDEINRLRARVNLSEWKFDNEYLKPLRAELKAKNQSVNVDSQQNVDSQKADRISIQATLSTVNTILENNYPDWKELSELEDLRLRSELSDKAAFAALVSGLRSKLRDVQPEDELQVTNLINLANTSLDFNQALPSMASDILHDAKILNIDPIGIWQYLLPAVLSVAGKQVDLDAGSHTIPAIAWTAIIAESGAGKTRAEKLVTSPLKELQKAAKAKYQADLEEIAAWNAEDGEEKPQEPTEQKYLFNVATIQAVMKRSSEQKLNGSLWSRDELIGLFQSLNQFSSGKGESEALSCLLDSWDGGDTAVDRVNQSDSYFLPASRLSIAGGIQPGIFKKCFSDPDDSQGLQARFLFALMKPLKPKRVKGSCNLSDKLPDLYHWLGLLPQGKIKLSPKADKLYDKLYESIGEQAMNTSMPVIRAWMFKLSAHLLRIALALHLIECYHDDSKDFWQIQPETLERAVLFAQYYRSTFHLVQTTAADTNDIASILVKIWDKALTRHPEGISARDAHRAIRAIPVLAKEANRSVAAFTVDLFIKLEEMGKGSVVKSGRQIRFVAKLSSGENQNPVDSLPIAETIELHGLEVSTEDEVSTLTVDDRPAGEPNQTDVDYSSFPHMIARAAFGVRKEVSQRIKREILAIDSHDSFKRLQTKYPKDQLNWVRTHLLSKIQRQQLTKLVTETQK